MKQKVIQAGLGVMLAAMAFGARAQGLQKATGTLNSVTTEIGTIVPGIATIGSIIILILWMNKTIRFMTFVQWAGGLLLIGSVPQIVKMLTS